MSNSDIETFEPTQNALDKSLAAMRDGKSRIISTFVGDDFETKVATFAAVSGAVKIADNLGATINLANIVVQPVEQVNESTGQVQEVPRVILIDDKGNAFAAISGVLFKRVEDLLGLVGHPSTWGKPLPVKVVKEGSGSRQFFDLVLAGK